MAETRTQKLQLLSPLTLEPVLATREATAMRGPRTAAADQDPLAATREKPKQQRNSAQPKIN